MIRPPLNVDLRKSPESGVVRVHLSDGAAVMALALVVLALAGGCFGGGADPKPPGSALWIASDSGELSSAMQSNLASVGLSELFLDAADLEWGERVTLARRKLPAVPRRSPSTLVVHGAWTPGEREPLEVSKQLLSELISLRIEAEQAGLLVVGYHVAVEPGARGEHLAKTLAALRRKLSGKAFLSIQIDRSALDGEFAPALAAASDFVVCFLYGQLPDEPEDPSAWDLSAVEGRFRRLDSLRRPYLTGAITLGAAYLHERGRAVSATSTRVSLGDLVNSRLFELRPGFSLQGIDRQVFEFQATAPGTLGEWRLNAGDSVRVVRTATPLVEEFRRRMGAVESPLRLGDIYYRLPRTAERLSLSAENLATVLGPASAVPQLELEIDRLAKAKERWIVRAMLRNRSAESSDLAFYDNNYVQVEVDGAVVYDAEPGDFRRVDLFHDGARGTMQALRSANQARFFLPLLEGGQVARSGPIELRLRGDRAPAVRVSASFLLPDGHLLHTDPIEWNFDEP